MSVEDRLTAIDRRLAALERQMAALSSSPALAAAEMLVPIGGGGPEMESPAEAAHRLLGIVEDVEVLSEAEIREVLDDRRQSRPPKHMQRRPGMSEPSEPLYGALGDPCSSCPHCDGSGGSEWFPCACRERVR